jgi:hypothetical protein
MQVNIQCVAEGEKNVRHGHCEAELKGFDVDVRSLKETFFKYCHCEKQGISSYDPRLDHRMLQVDKREAEEVHVYFRLAVARYDRGHKGHQIYGKRLQGWIEWNEEDKIVLCDESSQEREN